MTLAFVILFIVMLVAAVIFQEQRNDARRSLQTAKHAASAITHLERYILPALRFMRTGQPQLCYSGPITNENEARFIIDRTWFFISCRELADCARHMVKTIDRYANGGRDEALQAFEQRMRHLYQLAYNVVHQYTDKQNESEAAFRAFLERLATERGYHWDRFDFYNPDPTLTVYETPGKIEIVYP